MNAWVGFALGFAAGQGFLVGVLWWGHKLQDYRGRHAR